MSTLHTFGADVMWTPSLWPHERMKLLNLISTGLYPQSMRSSEAVDGNIQNDGFTAAKSLTQPYEWLLGEILMRSISLEA
jgi:hypothetical protein